MVGCLRDLCRLGAKPVCLELGSLTDQETFPVVIWGSFLHIKAHSILTFLSEFLSARVSQRSWWLLMGHPVETAAGCCRICFIMENPDLSPRSYILRKCLDMAQVPALKGDHSHTRQAMVLPKDKGVLCLPSSSQARSQKNSSNSRVLN